MPLPGGLKEQVTVTPDAKTLARGGAGSPAAGSRQRRPPSKLKQVYSDLGSRIGSRREKREVTAAFAGVGVVFLLVASGLSLAWTRRPL